MITIWHENDNALVEKKIYCGKESFAVAGIVDSSFCCAIKEESGKCTFVSSDNSQTAKFNTGFFKKEKKFEIYFVNKHPFKIEYTINLDDSWINFETEMEIIPQVQEFKTFLLNTISRSNDVTKDAQIFGVTSDYLQEILPFLLSYFNNINDIKNKNILNLLKEEDKNAFINDFINKFGIRINVLKIKNDFEDEIVIKEETLKSLRQNRINFINSVFERLGK